ELLAANCNLSHCPDRGRGSPGRGGTASMLGDNTPPCYQASASHEDRGRKYSRAFPGWNGSSGSSTFAPLGSRRRRNRQLPAPTQKWNERDGGEARVDNRKSVVSGAGRDISPTGDIAR